MGLDAFLQSCLDWHMACHTCVCRENVPTWGPVAFHSGPCVPALPVQLRQPWVFLVLPLAEGPMFTVAPEPAHSPTCAHTAALTFPGLWVLVPGSPLGCFCREPGCQASIVVQPIGLPPCACPSLACHCPGGGSGTPGRCCSGIDTCEGVPFCFLDCAEWACHCLYRVWPRLLQSVPPRFPQERKHLPDLQEKDEPQTLSPHLHLMRCKLPRRRTDSAIPVGSSCAFVGSLPPVS